MAASKNDIAAWFDRGVRQGATHMIVVCDTFNYEDYPIFVTADEDTREKAAEYDGKNMQRVMEVYSLSQSKDKQMAEHRALHYD